MKSIPDDEPLAVWWRRRHAEVRPRGDIQLEYELVDTRAKVGFGDVKLFYIHARIGRRVLTGIIVHIARANVVQDLNARC